MNRKTVYASDAAEAVSKAYNIPLHELVDLFAEVPTVEPKKGKWDSVDKWEHIFKCSVCGRIGRIPQQDGGYFGTNFCPNCGADMRGENND